MTQQEAFALVVLCVGIWLVGYAICEFNTDTHGHHPSKLMQFFGGLLFWGSIVAGGYCLLVALFEDLRPPTLRHKDELHWAYLWTLVLLGTLIIVRKFIGKAAYKARGGPPGH